jgi:hypothetical protein
MCGMHAMASNECCHVAVGVLQAETRRLEGVLYDQYWAAVAVAGFHVTEVQLANLPSADPQLGLCIPVDHSVRLWAMALN